jgi:hypothetical protein
MKIPSLDDARSIVAEAEGRNPGPWVGHSIWAAKAAQMIAGHCPGLDGETAYILGLLHDIGRRVGVTEMRHIFDGYQFLAGLGYEDAARISITHSFPVKNIRAVEGQWDCTAAEFQFIRDFINGIEYNDYDRLIQLCDSLALPDGICLIEKRFVEVALRHGLHEHTIQRWRAYLQIQEDFEKKLNDSIYHLLPGVIETTFRLKAVSNRDQSAL